jgi:signal peptidase II
MTETRQGQNSLTEHIMNLRKTIPSARVQRVFWPIVIVALALDLWSKAAVFKWLSGRGIVTVIDGFFQLVIAENAGAAFGIAQGQRFLLVTVSIVALAVMLVIFLLSGPDLKLIHIALGLFTAGLCGNLYDRIFNDGLVRDFIDIVYWPGKHWPAFNVADSMLCIAVGLMLISGFTEKTSR